MGLKVYNTLTRKKEDFEPVEPGAVKMYVCGVTVYDMCHIGHARSIVLFDVIYRYLQFKGYEVTYVRNFTDVDDKIIKRANELGEDWASVARRYIGEFYTDMDALGVLRPTIEPKATEHIGQIEDLVGKLIETGHAYQKGGDVVYDVESFLGYGKLSGKRIEDLVSGSRVEVDSTKRNPLDFTLWKEAKPGEPSWESPWGAGRPGWHIECSAMSMTYLGESFDIHGGGADLTFPHHENEIAQSEGATGKPFVKYWIHNGFVNIRSEKMSKSLGNVLNIRDILQKVHPEALRLFLLSSHYRSPLDYTDSSIYEASAALERLYGALESLDQLIDMNGQATEIPESLQDIKKKFSGFMDDDFNTPRCLAVLFEAARTINRISSEAKESPDVVPNSGLLRAVKDEMTMISRDLLGILSLTPQEFFGQIRSLGLQEVDLSPEEIQAMIDERAQARAAKDFAKADEIRDRLAEKGIALEDGPEGTTWKVKES